MTSECGATRPSSDVVQVGRPEAFQRYGVVVAAVITVPPAGPSAHVPDHVEAVFDVLGEVGDVRVIHHLEKGGG